MRKRVDSEGGELAKEVSDDGMGGWGDVDLENGLVVCGRFEGLQLATQEGSGHVVALAFFEAFPEEGFGAVQPDEARVKGIFAEDVAVGLSEGGTGDEYGLGALLAMGDGLRDSFEPLGAVVIG